MAVAAAGNVAERADIRRMIDTCVAEFGGLDVMFNNAGFNKPEPFLEITEEVWHQIMNVNALGVLMGCQEAAKTMIAQGTGGKIVNTASIAGRQGFPSFVPYCVSKFGVDRHHPGRRPRPRRPQDHRQRLRPRRRRHPAVGQARPGPDGHR